jgi:hypothetical protein
VGRKSELETLTPAERQHAQLVMHQRQQLAWLEAITVVIECQTSLPPEAT